MELAALVVWRVRVRGIRVRVGWTRPGLMEACVAGAVALVGFLVCQFALDGSPGAAVTGGGVWGVLSLWSVATRRVAARRRWVNG
ncbi:MAG: hypothetical protein LBK95_17705 [Bifidobacteriaceae bacterium]|jgi:hypothetical protein|nr:hypothetical protein [Bifidobacteriaceae bacterium]